MHEGRDPGSAQRFPRHGEPSTRVAHEVTVSVGFDPEIFVRQQRGGISRYFSELISTFASDADLGVDPILMAPRSSNHHLADSLVLPGPRRPLRPSGPGLQRLLNGPDWSKDVYLDYRAGTRQGPPVDILHATYFRPRRRDVRAARALAFTVYDLIPETLGVAGHSAHRGRREAFERADLLLAISRSTADVFADYYPQSAHKVVVVPLAVNHDVFNPTPVSAPAIGFPYLLYVGTRAGHKDFWVLPAALRQARDSSGLDIGLVAVGPPATPEEQTRIAGLLPRDRFTFVSADDEALADLYRSAEALVLTSRMEGFGLPLLEAAACGAPAIATDIPPFREVCGPAGKFVPPGSVSSLASAIAELTSSPVERAELSTSGILRAADFTWRSTAAATARAYMSVAQGSL